MKLPALLLPLLVTVATPAWGEASHVHDGFYLRLGGGVGFVSDGFEGDVPYLSDIEGTTTGLTIPGEIAIGGTVASGLALGAGLYAHYVPTPTATNVETPFGEYDVEYDGGTFLLVGPMVDYYFDRRQGLHLQGSVGFGLFSLGDGEVDDTGGNVEVDEQSGGGFGAMIGIGHEWWVADRWSVGVLGRLAFGATASEDDNDVEWSHTVLAPSLLVTATMN
jgi:hypothetical protein